MKALVCGFFITCFSATAWADDTSLALAMAQQQFWTTEYGKSLKKVQKSLEKDAQDVIKDTAMEKPMAIVLLGAKIAKERKVSFSTKNPLIQSQNLLLVISDRDIDLKIEGGEFLFPKSKYFIKTNTSSVGAGWEISF